MNETVFWLVATFVAAGFVKGVVGMGLPTVAMGILGLVMPPATAAAMLVVPSFVTNVWQLFAGPAFGGLLRRFAPMMIAVFVGTMLGIGVITGPSAAVAGIALGVALALYGVVGLTAPRFRVPRQMEYWLSPVVGFVTGLIAGATGIFVIPAVPYLNSLGLAKDELIQTLGLAFTVSTCSLAVALASRGQFQVDAAWTSLAAVIPALAGMFIGQKLRDRMHPEVFRKWFFAGLVVLGVYMTVRALMRGA